MQNRRRTALAAATACAACVLTGCGAAGPAPGSGDGREHFVLAGPFCAGEASVPWHATFSPDGRWVARLDGFGAPSRAIAVLDAATGQVAWSEGDGRQAAARPAVFARDSKRLFLIAGDRLLVKELDGGAWPTRRSIALGFEPAVQFPHPCRLALTPDERGLLLEHDAMAWRVDLVQGKTERVAPGIDGVFGVFVLLDGTPVLSVWRADHTETVLLDGVGNVRRTLPGALLEASPDGARWLVASGPRPELGGARPAPGLELQIVEAASGTRLGSFTVGDLTQAAFSPDGRYLVTGEDFKHVVLRAADSGRPLQAIREYEGDRIVHLAFGADGTTLLTAGRLGIVGKETGILSWRSSRPR